MLKKHPRKDVVTPSTTHPPAARAFVSDTERDAALQAIYGATAQDAAEHDDATCGGTSFKSVATKEDPSCDISGVVAACCKHEIIQGLVDMARGEQYGLHVIMERLIKDRYGGVSATSIDVACIYEKFIATRHLKVADDVILGKVHSRMHGDHCRVLLNLAKTAIGTADGECMERRWALLGAGRHCSKSMTKSGNRPARTFVCVRVCVCVCCVCCVCGVHLCAPLAFTCAASACFLCFCVCACVRACVRACVLVLIAYVCLRVLVLFA